MHNYHYTYYIKQLTVAAVNMVGPLKQNGQSDIIRCTMTTLLEIKCNFSRTFTYILQGRYVMKAYGNLEN